MELGPLSIKKWDAEEKNGEIDQFLAELVFWLSCKISFFTISNHTNGAAELSTVSIGYSNLGYSGRAAYSDLKPCDEPPSVHK